MGNRIRKVKVPTLTFCTFLIYCWPYNIRNVFICDGKYLFYFVPDIPDIFSILSPIYLISFLFCPRYTWYLFYFVPDIPDIVSILSPVYLISFLFCPRYTWYLFYFVPDIPDIFSIFCHTYLISFLFCATRTSYIFYCVHYVLLICITACI